MRIYFICSCFYSWHDSWLLDTFPEKNTSALFHPNGWKLLQDLAALRKPLTLGKANGRRCKAHMGMHQEQQSHSKWPTSFRADFKGSLIELNDILCFPWVIKKFSWQYSLFIAQFSGGFCSRTLSMCQLETGHQLVSLENWFEAL